MEQMSFDARKDRQGKDDSFCNRNKDGELLENSGLGLSKSLSKGLNKRVILPHALYLKLKQYRISRSYIHDSFFNCNIGLEYKVPKYMVTIDEKYVRRCLELIQISRSKSTRCGISMNMGPAESGDLSESLITAKLRSREMDDLDRLIISCPSTTEDGSTVISPSKLWFVGSIMGSESMVNILKNPLLNQLGISDGTSNFMDVNDIKGFTGSNFMDSPGGLDGSLFKELENTKSTKGGHQEGSGTVNERLFFTPSRNSMCSDQSSSGSVSAPLSQGMLQLTWKDGNPHFIFSVDDEKEVYVASSSKVKSADNKVLDYVYLFHSSKNGLMDREVGNSRSHTVGKMKVSTSFSVCPNNSKIVDTEFVLFGGFENFDMEMNTSNNIIKKNKVFTRKVAEVLRTSHSSKQRSISSFSRSSVIKDSCPWEPYSNKLNNVDNLTQGLSIPNDLPSNLELAAIVVRDHFPEDRGNKLGGWGLKFLKQKEAKQTNESLEASVQADCCARNSGKCSTSMDVLIPAGFHGGPRAKNSGPSSLTERWRSGGFCDCGGWDMGCSLSVLRGQSMNEENLPQAVMQECRTFNIHAQGSENGPPTLRMVNIRDDLYFVHFQPKLSFLQSFSIAVAIVHSRSSALRTRNVQQL